MGEHSTWFDFLNALPGWRNLQHTLEHTLGRGPDTAHPWTFAMFGDTHFTMSHVLSMLLVSFFLIVGGLAFRSAVQRAGGPTGREAVVPPSKFGLRNLFEMFSEAILNLAEGVMGKKNAVKYLPLLGTLAMIIFFCNALALIPGFAPPTDSLKTNLALAMAVFIATHFLGVKEHGLKYFKHFLGPVWWLAPLILLIEIISHIARPASLSLRLMGNMAADHKVVGVFFTLVPLLVPVPFLILGTLVVVVQTLVFTLLSMVYIGMAVAHEEHH